MSYYANQWDVYNDGMEKGLEEGREEGIKGLIKVNKKHRCSRKETEEDLIEQYALTEEEAAKKWHCTGELDSPD